jgi:glycerol-3-phosphate dehydrogenase
VTAGREYLLFQDVASLSRERRQRDLDSLLAGAPLDVVVVGGGITGVGAALDAAARGLSVALVERYDLASGTSSKSSRLVHGGLRYLANGDLAIAWQSARERHLLMTVVAPHLTRPLAFVGPLTDEIPRPHAAFVATLIRTARLLGRAAGTPRALLPPVRRIDPGLCRALAPALALRGLRGGLLYWDGQLHDDARLVVAVARTAAAYGARIITYCEAELADDGAFRARDLLSGDSFELSASVVINAAGVGAAKLTDAVSVRPSKGSHILVDAERLGHPRAAIQTPVPGDRRRAMLATPRPDGRVLIGPTDREATESDPVETSPDEVQFLLDAINGPLEHRLVPDDVVGSYAGVRPLVDDGRGDTTDLSRRHAVITEPERRLVTVIGGKLTTYRLMAEDAVDAALSLTGAEAPPSPTRRLALIGAADRAVLPNLGFARRLVERYGTEASRIARAEAAYSADPLVDGLPALCGEAVFAVRHEGALTAEDVVDRRLGLAEVADERAATIEAVEDVAARFDLPLTSTRATLAPRSKRSASHGGETRSQQ